MALVYSPGLALYLYPEELLRFGATHTAAADEVVTAEHYFLCLWTNAREGLWTPLHITRGQDRLPIPESAKSGHPRFAQGPTYYSLQELWRIPHKAVQRGAQVAGDKTGANNQSRVAPDHIPATDRFTVQPAAIA